MSKEYDFDWVEQRQLEVMEDYNFNLCKQNVFLTICPHGQKLIYYYEKTFILAKKEMNRADLKLWFLNWNPFDFVTASWHKDKVDLDWSFGPVFFFGNLKATQWWNNEIDLARFIKANSNPWPVIKDIKVFEPGLLPKWSLFSYEGKLTLQHLATGLRINRHGIACFNDISIGVDYTKEEYNLLVFLRYWSENFYHTCPDRMDEYGNISPVGSSFDYKHTFEILKKISS